MRNLEPHEYRLLAEREELQERLEKLNAFIMSPAFMRVDKAERDRLRHQVNHMGLYFGVLNERIQAIQA